MSACAILMRAILCLFVMMARCYGCYYGVGVWDWFMRLLLVLVFRVVVLVVVVGLCSCYTC